MYRAMNAAVQCYDVHFFDRRVLVTATCDPGAALLWVNRVRAYHNRRIARGRLVAGLAAEWPRGTGPRDREPAAVIQLCIGHHCLVFQLCHSARVPQALRCFLADARVCFVGIGLGEQLRRLGLRGLWVANAREARKLAAARWGQAWRCVSMEALVEGVLGYSGVSMDEAFRCSDWRCSVLTPGQVMHAAVGAYVAFRLGLAFLVPTLRSVPYLHPTSHRVPLLVFVIKIVADLSSPRENQRLTVRPTHDRHLLLVLIGFGFGPISPIMGPDGIDSEPVSKQMKLLGPYTPHLGPIIRATKGRHSVTLRSLFCILGLSSQLFLRLSDPTAPQHQPNPMCADRKKAHNVIIWLRFVSLFANKG
ncbi:hypothetical protein Taro_052076 [Colocasia esculenta]|uniref:3'-5' exonuclease domain-containing protein n=1 Tax=Colocasia esculenta TaxID=4460 RepID=A0A843XIX0_COLES|nr:hypothetical protein [Colocasia esculenta]